MESITTIPGELVAMYIPIMLLIVHRIKKTTLWPELKTKMPYISMAVGVFVSIAYFIQQGHPFTAKWVITAIVYGLALGTMQTGSYEVLKNLKKK